MQIHFEKSRRQSVEFPVEPMSAALQRWQRLSRAEKNFPKMGVAAVKSRDGLREY
jgi:hypothetical protein